MDARWKALYVLLNCLQFASHFVDDLPNCQSGVYCKGALLKAIQDAKLFNDSKTYVDMKLQTNPDAVLRAFENLTSITPEVMDSFVKQYFQEPGTEFEDWVPTDWKESPAVLNHIKDTQLRQWGSDLNKLWKVLGRKIKEDVKNNPDLYSLIYVPHPFVVPGGRFREFYYWDSYWVVNGLLLSEMTETVKGMILNFLDFVDNYGFVPNGGRVYYTRRSQPPYLIPIIEQYYDATNDDQFLRDHIVTMEKEYQFWIENRTVVVNQGGETYKLARYAVDIGQPRPESFREDEETGKGLSQKEAAELYSNIASAAESGWDFSTRWFGKNNQSMKSIRTRNIVPVDLNAILCMNEMTLSRFYGILGNTTKSKEYANRVMERKAAIEHVLWDEKRGIWLDFDLEHNARNDEFYASNIVPMWAGCYGSHAKDVLIKQKKVLNYLKTEGVLDYPGGVPTSKIDSNQQWDFPNAWPPLQQMIIWALDSMSLPEGKKYAQDIAQRWTLTNWRSWEAKGHMFEKYNALVEGLPGSGGEYDVQVGFGWTNGVALQILDKYGDVLHADSASGSNVKKSLNDVEFDNSLNQVSFLLPDVSSDLTIQNVDVFDNVIPT